MMNALVRILAPFITGWLITSSSRESFITISLLELCNCLLSENTPINQVLTGVLIVIHNGSKHTVGGIHMFERSSYDYTIRQLNEFCSSH